MILNEILKNVKLLSGELKVVGIPVVLSVTHTVTVFLNDKEIFSTALIPVNGIISIYGVADLIHAEKDLSILSTIKFRVERSGVLYKEIVAELMRSRDGHWPMSSGDGTIFSNISGGTSSFEYPIPFHFKSDKFPGCNILYEKAGEQKIFSFTPEVTEQPDGTCVSWIDAHSLLNEDNAIITALSFRVGNVSKYLFRPSQAPRLPIYFKNNFGAWELAELSCEIIESPMVDISTAKINDSTVTYDKITENSLAIDIAPDLSSIVEAREISLSDDVRLAVADALPEECPVLTVVDSDIQINHNTITESTLKLTIHTDDADVLHRINLDVPHVFSEPFDYIFQ